jgi:Leishmanolysin
MSGCSSSIPLEQGGGAGSNCGHWAEKCFLNEVMTSAANSDLPISRLTIAGLEDLGYTVDYGTAEAFGAQNMDPSCVCDTTRRSLLRDKNASVRRLSGPARQLSEEGQQTAIAYGQGIMAQNRQQNSFLPDSDDAVDIGGDLVYVLYLENDTVYSMMVTPFD